MPSSTLNMQALLATQEPSTTQASTEHPSVAQNGPLSQSKAILPNGGYSMADLLLMRPFSVAHFTSSMTSKDRKPLDTILNMLLTTTGDWVPIDSATRLLPGAVEWAQNNGYSHVGTNCIQFVNEVFVSSCQGVDLDAFFRRQTLIPRHDITTGATAIRWEMDFPFSRVE